jgi:ABC-type branched-subunit amino acid transport system ATPase component/ABC-type branched-subunit amino acid transport system permease subunit
VKQFRGPLLLLAMVEVVAIGAGTGLLSSANAAILSYAAIAGILALSLNLIMGYAGQISLAQASFLGLGGFVTGYIVAPGHLVPSNPLSLPVALVASVLIGALVAVIVGLPALRLKGIFLAISTFAFADAFENYIFNIQQFSGLNSGVTVPRPYLAWIHLDQDSGMLEFALVCLALAWLLDARLLGTRHGRALLALRESEDVAASFGVPVSREKLRAFLLSGALAGLAGCLYAYQVTVIVKASFALQVSLLYLIVVVVGGLGSRAGVVVSAALFTILPYVFEIPALHFLLGWDIILLPALLILTIVRYPGGLPEQVAHIRERRELKRRKESGEDVAGLRPAMVTDRAGGDILPLAPRGGDLRVEAVSVAFGGLAALHQVDLEVPAGAAVGLIGPNGAGKSTLFNVISGFQRPTAGRVVFEGADITARPAHTRAALGISRTFQQVGLVRRATLLENLLLAQHASLQYGATAGILGAPAARRLETTAREEAMTLLQEVGLADFADLRVGVLSTGQQRLVELACAVASRPRLVLLDEPSAGMSPAASEHLAEQLARLRKNYATGLLLIEHHIPLVLAVCESAYVLDSGQVLAHGPAHTVVRQPEVVDAYMGEAV